MPNKQNETQVSKIKTNVERLVLAAGAAALVQLLSLLKVLMLLRVSLF
jgi:hypothetical protein